jgi:hypothetical protein
MMVARRHHPGVLGHLLRNTSHQARLALDPLAVKRPGSQRTSIDVENTRNHGRRAASS